MTDILTNLSLYENARMALAELHRIDEVKDIRDKATALEAYARQAKDTELMDKAVEIRMRAEIRAGELLREMSERGERQKSGDASNKATLNGSRGEPLTPTLTDLGVTKKQSHKWQKLAALPKEEQDAIIANVKSPRRSKSPKIDRARAIIREHGMGPVRQMEAEHGISLGSFQRAQIAEEARREALAELGVTVDDLKPTAKQKFEILEKRLRAEMEVEIARRIREGVREGVAEALAKRDKVDAETIEQANVFLARQGKKPFTAKEFTTVLLRALHPDASTPESRLEAFKLVKSRQLLLREEGRIVTRTSLAKPLPKTAEEWAAAKAAKQEERRKKNVDSPLEKTI